MVSFLQHTLALILLVLQSYSYNLLCDLNINWIQVPTSDTYLFNQSTCQIAVSSSSNMYEKRLISVSSIFSDTSNYPINFTINANPYSGDVKFGIIFRIANAGYWGYTVTTSVSTQISYQWLTAQSNTYNQYYEPGNDVSGTTMSGNIASDIIEIGIQVGTDLIAVNNNVMFDYVGLSALKIMPTSSPTRAPSTTEASNAPTTDNPTTDNPTTNIPTTLSPTTNTPTTVDPTRRPTVTEQFMCDGNGYVMEISFEYVLNSGANTDMVDSSLLSIFEDVIRNKNESLTDCYISKSVMNIATLTHNKAIVNMSLCTECEQNEIENNLLNELLQATDDNGILSVETDSVIIQVDVIQKGNDESEHEYVTTQNILNTENAANNGSNDGFWILITVLLCVICACLLIVAICVAKRIKNDKQSQTDIFNTNVELKMTNVNVSKNIAAMPKVNDEIEGNATVGNINVMSDDIIICDDESPGNDNNSTPSEQVNHDFDEVIRTKGYESADTKKEKVRNWLAQMGVENYFGIFIKNGYDSMDIICAIRNVSDLQDIGIDSVQHQTYILSQIQVLNNEVNVTEGNVYVYD